MAFAYFLVFPTVFRVMQAFTPEGVEWMPDIGTYLSFVMNMFIAFGVTFQVPVVVIILVRMGVVTVAKLKEITALRDRGRVRRRGGRHAAGCDVADPAGVADLPALRSRHPAGFAHGASAGEEAESSSEAQ